MAAEDYTGRARASAAADAVRRAELPRRRTRRRSTPRASPTTSTTSTRRAPHRIRLGVLSHYDAVIWYTGDDLVHATSPPAASRAAPGMAKLLDDEVLAARDYMNDGGNVLVTGQQRAAGRLGPVPLQPAGADAAEPVLQVQPDDGPERRGRPAGPAGQLHRGLQRLPAVLAGRLPAHRGSTRRPPLQEVDAVREHGVRARPGRQPAGAAVVRDDRRSLLPDYPAFNDAEFGSAAGGADADRAGVRPARGRVVRVRSADVSSGYQRLTPHVRPDRAERRTGGRPVVQALRRHRGRLRLRVRRGAHGRPGRLPDAARPQREHDSDPDTGVGCTEDSDYWLERCTRSCAATSSRSGSRTGHGRCDPASAGHLERGHRQLRRLPGLAGRPVGLRRPAGRGVDRLPDRSRARWGSARSSTTSWQPPTAPRSTRPGFEDETLGGWAVTPPPAGSPAPNTGDWARSQSPALRRRPRHRAPATRSSGASASRACRARRTARRSSPTRSRSGG